MKTDFDVLIVGGGLTGPMLGLALASAGISASIIDAAAVSAMVEPDFDGRAYALSQSSVRFFKALGLWPQIAGHAQPIEEIKISDGKVGVPPSPLFLHFRSEEIDQGPMGYIVEDRYLRRVLLQALGENALTAHAPQSTVISHAVAAGGVTVSLSSGADLTARLLIGCDGRASGVASRAGIGRMGWDYGQSSLVCALEHERPHSGIAHQLFLPQGPLAILPLTGNRSSIVWTEERSRAEAIQRLDDAAYLEELRPRFGSFLGELSLSGKRFSYPLGLSLAASFVAERVALAGDAAHGIHPLAGQGLNLGLRDVAALAEVLAEARRGGEDLGAAPVLERYQQWRRFDTAVLVSATDAINRLFSNDNPILRAGRDLGLGLVNQIPVLRRSLIREAAGLSGDMPRLLSGRAL